LFTYYFHSSKNKPSNLLLQHPVTWQPSGDGTKLIGHMILKKSGLLEGGKDSSAILGTVVVTPVLGLPVHFDQKSALTF
jgi:hypothetical protein